MIISVFVVGNFSTTLLLLLVAAEACAANGAAVAVANRDKTRRRRTSLSISFATVGMFSTSSLALGAAANSRDLVARIILLVLRADEQLNANAAAAEDAAEDAAGQEADGAEDCSRDADNLHNPIVGFVMADAFEVARIASFWIVITITSLIVEPVVTVSGRGGKVSVEA